MPSTPAAQYVATEGKEESSLYKGDLFRMYCTKVLPCCKMYCHDWTTCPFCHSGEKARRRDLRTQPHTGIACPNRGKEGTCVRGDNCPYAHNVFEYWLHPTRYRTQLCHDGTKCRRHICFFAHSLEELRVSTCKPFVPSEALAASMSAAAVDIACKAGDGTLNATSARSLAKAALAKAVMRGPHVTNLGQNMLQSNPTADALVRQLPHMVQNDQVNYQQQQQEQLNEISTLTAYLQEAQVHEEGQSQSTWAQHSNNRQPLTPLPSRAMSGKQQQAFQALSEAAGKHRLDGRQSSEISCAGHKGENSSASYFSADAMQAQTAGMLLAQQSLLYAPSQQQQKAARNPGHQLLQGQGQFEDRPFTTCNPIGSTHNSFDFERSSDLGGRPRYSQDWGSNRSGPASPCSQENDFLNIGRQSSIGTISVGRPSSYDVAWAGKPVSKPDAPNGFVPGQETFNPFQDYIHFNRNLQETSFPQDAFTQRPFRASQDSNASTPMHIDRGRRSVDNRPSTESIRSEEFYVEDSSGHARQMSNAFNPFQEYIHFHRSPQELCFPQDAFSCRPFQASQDSSATTLMHIDGSKRRVNNHPSKESEE